MKLSQDITLRIEWDASVYRGWREALKASYGQLTPSAGRGTLSVTLRREGALYTTGRDGEYRTKPVTAEELETTRWEPEIRNPYRVSRGGGDSIILGDCGMCGHRLSLSGANLKGARCRYEGAQYDKDGRYLYAAHTDPRRKS